MLYRTMVFVISIFLPILIFVFARLDIYKFV